MLHLSSCREDSPSMVYIAYALGRFIRSTLWAMACRRGPADRALVIPRAQQERKEAMKMLSRIMIALVMLGATGCAGSGGPATVAPTVNITGKWAGTWVATSATLGSGLISMTVTQTGSDYAGDLLVTGTLTDPSGPTGGIVSGNEVRMARPTNLTGSLMVQGDTMKGTLYGVVDANVTLNRQK
jgi:hypothetical protein